MSWGTVTVGRLALRESLDSAAETVDAQTGSRTLTIVGQEAHPDLTSTQIAQIQDDIHGLYGAFVPATFTMKSDRNGYYRVAGAQATLANWSGEVITADWQLVLSRVGSDTEVDIESRLSGAVTRNTSFAATGERWHAPPPAAYGYWSGTSIPSTVSRTGTDGAVTVYRGVGSTVNPRWGCSVGNYLAGRCRFLDGNGVERTGLGFTTAATGWELSNSLTKVNTSPAGSGVLQVSAYTGGGWQAKQWDILAGGSSLGAPLGCSVLRNEPECVIVRLLFGTATLGRVTVDALLRRGSRFVELYVQAETSTTLKVVRGTTEAGTSGTGYVSATSNDGAGNRYIVGSALTFTADTANGGLSLASTTTLDAFVGVVVGGGSAVAGDQAANLYSQYLGAPAESVQGVRR